MPGMIMSFDPKVGTTFERPSDEPLTEIVEGEEVPKQVMGVYEGLVASSLCGELFSYLKQAALGRVVSEVMFRVLPDKRTMRRPDVAFVSYGRWGRDLKVTSANGWDVIPDLVVEVVSPTDLAAEVMEKVQEYLDAGVVRVWVIYPNLRKIHSFDVTGESRIIGPNGSLGDDDLLPGFQLALADLFRDGANA